MQPQAEAKANDRAASNLSSLFRSNICACIYICMHMYVYVCICICICICVCLCICICVCMHVYIYMYIHMVSSTWLLTKNRAHMLSQCRYLCVHKMYTYIYTYVYMRVCLNQCKNLSMRHIPLDHLWVSKPHVMV